MSIGLDANGVPLSQNYDISYGIKPHAYYQFTVTAGEAQTLQALIGGSVPEWAQLAFLVPETGAIRYRCDGTLPTPTVGMPVQPFQPWPIQGQAGLAALQIISQSGSVNISFELRG